MKDRKFEQIYQYIKENYTEELERLRKVLIKNITILVILISIASVMCGIIWERTGIKELGLVILGGLFMYSITTWVKYNKAYQI